MADMAKLATSCWAVLKEELQAHLNDSRPLKQQEQEFRAAVKKKIGQE